MFRPIAINEDVELFKQRALQLGSYYYVIFEEEIYQESYDIINLRRGGMYV